jgi:hypothetical protein
MADPRKIVFLTTVDRVVDHPLLLTILAGTGRSMSLVLCQPVRGWRLGVKGILPLRPKIIIIIIIEWVSKKQNESIDKSRRLTLT